MVLKVEIIGSHQRKHLIGTSIIYRIKSNSSNGDDDDKNLYPHSEYFVFREYQHFKQLYSALITYFPGVLIPYLPDQSLSSAADFQNNLQSFLQQIVQHPILQSSACVISFIQGSIENFLLEYNQSQIEERGRRSTIYLPTLMERMENKLNSYLNGDEWYFGVNHIDFRMREIVEYSDRLESANQNFLLKGKCYFEAKQKLLQPLFAWESSLQCVLLEDGIYFTQTGRRPLALSNLLQSSIQIDSDLLLTPFHQNSQNIFTLQLALKRWKDRKSKLLSAAKQLALKKHEKLKKLQSKDSLKLTDSPSSPPPGPPGPSSPPPSSPKTCQNIFDRWLLRRDSSWSKSPSPSPQQTPVQDKNLNPVVGEVEVDTERKEESNFVIPSATTEQETAQPMVGEINDPDHDPDPDQCSASAPPNPVIEKQGSIPTPPGSGPGPVLLDAEIRNWMEVVRELQEEYRTLSEQTLTEFNRFMENKQRLVMDSIFQYANQQLQTCQEFHQVWENTLTSLLEDDPSFDQKSLNSNSITQFSQHSFINKFGLANPYDSEQYRPGLESSHELMTGEKQDLRIRPILSFVGDENQATDEYCPLFVSDAGTVEI